MKLLVSFSLLFALLLATRVSAQEPTLYLLRHFEKQTGGDDPALTAGGQQRARQLALDLADAGVQEIYSSDYARTRQTVTPLARKLGLTIQLYDPNDLDQLAAILTEKHTNIVVAGHSNTTPALVRLLGGQAEDMDESQYGILFKLHRADDKVVTVLSEIGLNSAEN